MRKFCLVIYFAIFCLSVAKANDIASSRKVSIDKIRLFMDETYSESFISVLDIKSLDLPFLFTIDSSTKKVEIKPEEVVEEQKKQEVVEEQKKQEVVEDKGISDKELLYIVGKNLMPKFSVERNGSRVLFMRGNRQITVGETFTIKYRGVNRTVLVYKISTKDFELKLDDLVLKFDY